MTQTVTREQTLERRRVVDGLLELNRHLSMISTLLGDIGTAVVVLNVKMGPRGDAQTNQAHNNVHAAFDEVQGAQRVLMGLLQGARARVEAFATDLEPETPAEGEDGRTHV